MLPKSAKRKIILITDGDRVARKAVEKAAENIGGRCISASAGNPTPIDGRALVELIKQTPHDPVVVMVDDRGARSQGKGEKVLEYVASHPDVEVIGVLAVASNTGRIDGTKVDCAVTNRKKVVQGEVDKAGEMVSGQKVVMGDTVDVLNRLGKQVPFVVGVGDIGKMDGADDAADGAEITTEALNLIVREWQNRQQESRSRDGDQ